MTNTRHAHQCVSIATFLMLAFLGSGPAAAPAGDPIGSAPSKAVDDLSGYYEIAGKRPAGLADFQIFQLDQQTPGSSAVLTGYVQVRNRGKAKDPYRVLQFEQVTRAGNRLSFRTEERNGERYEFAGDLLKTGNFGALFGNDKVIVLKGHLKRLVNGEVKSDSEIKFDFFMGG
jgi:hypothetical protein